MKLTKLFILILLSMLVIGCDGENKENVLIVGTSADNPPYEFIQEGKVVGLDIDIINMVANRLGKKVIIKNLDFPGLLAALASKNIDLVISGLSTSPEREAKVDFSIAYTSAAVVVVYRAKDVFASQTDLRDKHVGAQLGTIWSDIAQDLATKFNVKVHLLANNLTLIEELRSKVIDAVVLEEVQGKQFIASNPELAMFTLENVSSKFAIALPKGSVLKTSIDEAIATLEQDGSLAVIRKKWLE